MKRKMTMVLAAMMAAGLMAGCSSGTSAETEAAAANEQTEAETQESSQEESAEETSQEETEAAAEGEQTEILGAAAASLKKEYTLPGVSQTVILTRAPGRTPVPEKENMASLAAHKATMIIFLSVGQIGSLAGTLAESYGWETPAAVVYKASWPEEKIVRGTLKDIGEKVAEAGIKKTALIVVGEFLGNDYELSKLYDAEFETGYRKASH